MVSFVNIFNSRELALITIISIIVIAILLDSKTNRSNGLAVIKAILSEKLLVIYSIYLSYLAIMLFYFYKVNILSLDVCKDSIMWFFTFAWFNTYKMRSIVDFKSFSKLFLKSISFTAFIELVMTKFTFSYSIELIVVFLSILFTYISYYTKRNIYRKPEYRRLHSFSNYAIIVLGGIVLVNLIYNGVSNFNVLISKDSLISILLSPVLSLFFLPFYYIVLVYFNLEQTYINMKSWKFIDQQRKRIIMQIIIFNSIFSIKKMVNSRKFVLHNKAELANNDSLNNFIKKNL